MTTSYVVTASTWMVYIGMVAYVVGLYGSMCTNTGMSFVVVVYIGMAYMVRTYVVTANRVWAYIVLAFAVSACIGMAYAVTAHIDTVLYGHGLCNYSPM